MIRLEHLWHDVREILGSPKILIGSLVVAAFFILYISFQFVYLFAILFGTILAARGLIGRRCPICDAPLKETGAERDEHNVFVMHIIWRCPKSHYEEKEETKGDAGLFGAN